MFSLYFDTNYGLLKRKSQIRLECEFTNEHRNNNNRRLLLPVQTKFVFEFNCALFAHTWTENRLWIDQKKKKSELLTATKKRRKKSRMNRSMWYGLTFRVMAVTVQHMTMLCKAVNEIHSYDFHIIETFNTTLQWGFMSAHFFTFYFIFQILWLLLFVHRNRASTSLDFWFLFCASMHRCKHIMCIQHRQNTPFLLR